MIQVKNLYKSFPVKDGMVDVLKNINVSIEDGTFVMLFGPSGCGKSTLLHIMLGLEPPTKGLVAMQGKDFYQMKEDERSLFRRTHVGIIYQQPLWISSLDVVGNVAFPMSLRGEIGTTASERALKSLEGVGMDRWAHYHPTELSSGQQQKVALARAVALDPEIIVADEPTGNLDTVSGQELIDLFVSLARGKKKTIIMVTHDLEYLRYGDGIVHMLDGEIVEVVDRKKIVREKMKDTADILSVWNVRDKELLKKVHLDAS